MSSEARILLVDDEQSVLNALNRFFRRNDYDVQICTSAQEALKLMEDSEPFHLVISDYRMPDMNGVEFLSIVRSRWPETVRIVLSGFADYSAIIDATNKGNIYKFISKPWDEEYLLNSVKEALNLNSCSLRRTMQSRMLDEALAHMCSLESDGLVSQSQVLSVYHTLLDQMPVGLVGIDKVGDIASMNEMARRLLGLSVSPVGEPAAHVLSGLWGDAAVMDAIDTPVAVKAGNRDIKVLVKRLHEDGTEGLMLIMVLLDGGDGCHGNV
jgi:two-component system NtrC family sensor kinase